jgi:hypothetical protein
MGFSSAEITRKSKIIGELRVKPGTCYAQKIHFLKSARKWAKKLRALFDFCK